MNLPTSTMSLVKVPPNGVWWIMVMVSSNQYMKPLTSSNAAHTTNMQHNDDVFNLYNNSQQ